MTRRPFRRDTTPAQRVSNAIEKALQPLEQRVLFAAHIVGSTASYTTIQAAVNAAVAGQTITVDAGTYTETVTVNKSLTIRGAQAGVDARGRSASESIVTGATVSSAKNASFIIAANDVTIDGFTIQGETNQSVSTGAGIVMNPSIAGTHIYDNIIQNNVAGIFLANSSATDAAIIQHNTFVSNNNTGVNGGRGIYTDGGISGGLLTNVWIEANTFTNNHGGSGTTTAEAAIAFEAMSAGKQSNLHVLNNTFSGNGKATLCFYSDQVYIEGNTIYNQNDSAGTIRFEGGDTNVYIEYNTCYNNGGTVVAIDAKGVPANDSGFTIEYNNFYNNSTDWGDKLSVIAQAMYYTGTLDATNNWWGNASGPGGQGPGTGDKVYGDGHWNSGGQWTEAVGSEVTFSNWATALIALPSASAPTSLAATTVLTGTPPTSASVTLNWAASNAAPIEQVVYRSTDGTTYYPIALVDPGTTTYTDSAVNAATTYYYRVSAENLAGAANSSAVQVTTPTIAVTQLSSLNWSSATAGYGVVQKNKSINGNTITLNGANYGSGLGTHASSTIVYNLAGMFNTFVADVGIDGEEDNAGTGHVEFQVYGDNNTLLYDSGVLTNDQVGHINVSVAGVQTLTLKAVNGVANSIDYDHADWAGAALYGTPVIPNAPISVTAAAASTTSINLTWAPTSANQTSFQIDRSTDGTNWTTIATNIGQSATTYTDTALASNTRYFYRVRAVNAVGSSAASATVNATTQNANAVSTPLSSLQWTSATTGYGTIQLNKSINGNTLTLNGATYTTGIGTHAASDIKYNLAGNYTTFTTDVGIDGEEDNAGTGHVRFQVYGDGTLLYDSGVLVNDQVGHVNVSVAGVQQLELVATNGVSGSIDYDHSDWAGATLVGVPAAPTAPSGVAATALSSSSIKLAWVQGSSNTTSYTIERSLDASTWSTIATGIAASATTYTDNVGLSASTRYYYRITAVNSVGSSTPSTVVNATTQQLFTVTYVSDLTATSSTVGYGTIQKDKSINGNPLTLNGTTYTKGIGTHAASTITYNLAGKYSYFVSDVGIDGEEDGKGNGYVDFQVWGDGTLLYDSGVLTNDQVAHINVSVAGVQNLQLIASNGVANNIDYDHADWAGAELLA